MSFRSIQIDEMASSTTRQSCSTCQKSQGQVICGGCDRWLCIKHLLEHRQELEKELEKCVHQRNQLQASLIADTHDRQDDLLTRVDRWEAQSIERIKQVAKQVRSQLSKSLSRSKRSIGEALHPVTTEMEEGRKTDDYNENELKRWEALLKELKEQLEQAPMVELMHDEDERSSSHIPLIHLQIPQKQKGKRNQCE